MSQAVTTLPELLRRQAAKHPLSPFVLFQNEQLSYEAFGGAVFRVANSFLRAGARRGEKIALLLANCPEFLTTVFAATEIGAVFVPINTAFTADEIGYVLHHSESTWLVTTASFLPVIERVRAHCPDLRHVLSLQPNNDAGVLSWEKFLFGAPDTPLQRFVLPDEIASITYTSGTTDRPKGVMLSQYSYCFAPQKRGEALGWGEEDRAFVMMPLFHVNALCHMAIAMFSVGGSIVLKEKFSASQFWDEVREYGVTTSSVMRTIPQILLNLPEKPDDAKNPLRLAVALLPPEQHLRFEERFGVTLVPSYSLTEDILSVLGPLDKSRRRLGSCGLPIAPKVHRLRILNEEEGECAPGELGEITKQSPTIMKGYYKNPTATADAIRGDWLYTGDIGYLDEAGFLYFVDRKKDMVKRGDENVSSEEVESVLNAHPLIGESAVIGVPDPIRQEEIKALIVLKAPNTQLQLPPAEIWAHCRKHLAPFKVPRYVEYRDELPKTPSSKIQKGLLRREGADPSRTIYDRLAEEKR